MTKTKELYLISITLISILVFGSMVSVTDFENTIATASDTEKGNLVFAGTPHAPIVIDGDANFSSTADNEGWLGDGSAETPYIIDGLDIDLGGAAGHCISISNTRVNFTISNCN